MARRAARPAAKKIDRFLAQASKVGRDEIERMARAILAGRNPATSFCMAMGGAAFYDKKGEPLDSFAGGHTPRWLARFEEFIEEYDQALRLTGNPMKIDGAEAPVITDW